MKRNAIAFLALWTAGVTTVSGCGLSTRQHADIKRWEREAAELGHPEVKYVEQLDPGTATGLGFLPFGVAGFYVHRPGLAVSGILCWPLSITWTPAVAGVSASNWNYDEFRKTIVDLRAEAQADTKPETRVDSTRAGLADLERLRVEHKISEDEYAQVRRRMLDRLANE